MTRSLAGLLLLALAGCTTVKVSHRDIDDPERSTVRGSIVVKAVRGTKPEKLAGGYEFSVERRQLFSGYYETSSESPTAVEDLDPGYYQVVISGKHIQPITVDVSVRPGKSTNIVLWVRKARRAAVVEDIASTTGKALVFPIFGVVYVLLGDGEDDDEDVQAVPLELHPQQGRRESKAQPGSAGQYRKK